MVLNPGPPVPRVLRRRPADSWDTIIDIVRASCIENLRARECFFLFFFFFFFLFSLPVCFEMEPEPEPAAFSPCRPLPPLFGMHLPCLWHLSHSRVNRILRFNVSGPWRNTQEWRKAHGSHAALLAAAADERDARSLVQAAASGTQAVDCACHLGLIDSHDLVMPFVIVDCCFLVHRLTPRCENNVLLLLLLLLLFFFLARC
jgi:hypothetical protein